MIVCVVWLPRAKEWLLDIDLWPLHIVDEAGKEMEGHMRISNPQEVHGGKDRTFIGVPGAAFDV